jgi:predicted ATPase/class 3 adenylate cyclase/Tfp pilus assembly protein PilF
MRELPSGTVTFLFTDIEGSTRLLHELGDAYADALREHRRLLRDAFARHRGWEVGTEGDSFFVAFTGAGDALAAAAEAQEALKGGPISVRMGLHTGEPLLTEEGYVGIDVHRAARIAAAGHGGQILISQATRNLLDSTLGLGDLGEHRLKDLTTPERIYQLGHDEHPPLKSLNQTNLPVQPTPLIGREHELAELLELLRSGRLVTLTGPGGSGKTRLALQAAAELVGEFPEGVWFVSLAPVRDPDLVLPTIAQTLGVTQTQTLDQHLERKQALLMLDNFEQLLDAGPRIAELLQRAPAVKALVTSRASLHLMGEREYPVPPLADDDAFALFVERVRAARPSFEPDENVSAICKQLDNLPLALELAAARTKVLMPEQLLERLEQRLPLLSGGARDAPERQQTLRATIDWSYDLLTAEEKLLFSRLAVFEGSFDLEAAEKICDADLDTLASLIDKSLVRQTAEGRFFMLATIREYASGRFDQLPGTADVSERHTRHFFDLAVTAERKLAGADMELWLARLAADYADVRAALARAAELAPEDELAFALALTRFWRLRLQLTEGRRLLEGALHRAREAPRTQRALASYRLGDLAFDEGDYGEAKARFEEGLRLFRSEADERHVAFCLNGLAIVAQQENRLGEARDLFDEAIARAREAGDHVHAAGFAANLGLLELDEGNDSRAVELFREGLAGYRKVGEREGAGFALENLGFVALSRGRLHEASSLLVEALELAGRSASRLALFCLVGLAGVESGHGRHLRSARLLGAVAGLCEETHLTLEHHEAQVEAATRSAARNALGEEAFGVACNEGMAMDLARAIEFAIVDIDTESHPGFGCADAGSLIDSTRACSSTRHPS